MSQAVKQFGRLMAWDFRLQRIYYFWLTGLVIAAVWLALLLSLGVENRLYWLPVLIFADIGNLGLLFIAGILYLERSQGTVQVVAIMPVSHGLWLSSKVASLTVLGSVSASAIVLLSLRDVSWHLLIPAIAANVALFASAGFILACPFKKILNYFFAMALALAVLNIPLLDYLDIYNHPAMWILPSHAALQMLVSAFSGVFGATYVLSSLVLVCWVGLLHWAGAKMHRHYLELHGS